MIWSPFSPWSRLNFYIAISRDTPADVVHAWQLTLDSLKQDGAFEKMYRRYLPDFDLDDLLKRQPECLTLNKQGKTRNSDKETKQSCPTPFLSSRDRLM